jgi:hypothetical protein
MEMTAEKCKAKERDLEYVRVSREDSSSNLVPSETLEVTCKILVKHIHHRIDRYLRSTKNEILANPRLPKIITR